ncbi:helix-turn-helix transcriptional regulator [Glycomyces sp. NRRL B-16210]|uniref:helix-turn-helix domain-containing protein n=1 Tax=Glycomyces sp. NRRL B-16210 TaxID=1463821 RepID=UPI0004C00EF3|nr:helix-turn-helix transcriptional regulator [Glycomyces sp. NRRL B-16210]
MSTVSELRRQVGRELAAQRELAGKKVTDPEAAAIAGSTRTLKRLENGVPTRLTYAVIGRLARYYGAPDQIQFELERIWRYVNDDMWAQPSHAVENSGWDAYMEFERLAAGLDQFETMYVPGPVQTEFYMRRLFERSEVSRERIPVLIEHRLARQTELLQKLGSIRLRYLLTEAVLKNGCDDEQLSRMLELDEHPNVTIKVLELADGPYPLMDVPYSVLSFRNTEEPSIVYLESPYERRFYENSDAVGKYHQIFEGGLRQAKSLKEFQR